MTVIGRVAAITISLFKDSIKGFVGDKGIDVTERFGTCWRAFIAGNEDSEEADNRNKAFIGIVSTPTLGCTEEL